MGRLRRPRRDAGAACLLRVILIDTNTVSEPLRRRPEPRVTEWIDSQPLETLYLSTVTVAELRFGVASLPAGRRRSLLNENLERRILPRFAGRVLPFDLPFDLPATEAYALLMAQARRDGVAVSASDGYIAAIATANGMAVATRDRTPFEAAGLRVIDPWKSGTARG